VQLILVVSNNVCGTVRDGKHKRLRVRSKVNWITRTLKTRRHFSRTEPLWLSAS